MLRTLACSGGITLEIRGLTKSSQGRGSDRGFCVGGSVGVRDDQRLGTADCFDGTVLDYDEHCLVVWVLFFPLAAACCFAFCFSSLVVAICCLSCCLSVCSSSGRWNTTKCVMQVRAYCWRGRSHTFTRGNVFCF